MPSNKGKDEDNKGTSQRGFASMDEDKQREIASKGGKAAHEKGTAHEFISEEAREAGRAAHDKGTAHEFTSEEAREAGRKGGQSHGKGASKDEDESSSRSRGKGDSEDEDESSSSTRGGTSEQHAKAGRQSHKNR
ncbi:KGG domain-containing protein [Nitrosomonas communis]|uniref:Stress-induced acidophilic repeat motif-containing protein n=1 Tax=Nitrosomonas communis TaxID=44574 RepID=A0A1I4U7Z9_9PROT|nr:KGG domain-containing protein [Nitrosomonas communis]SFM85092.1 Stress-induced acidophilic repeat motif-containing protein [Nitrosomonas communis]